MKVNLGYDARGASKGKIIPLVWDTKKLLNGHALFMGKSGTGKTYTLRDIITQIAEQAKRDGKEFRCHIMDVHGDIVIDDASTVKFSESTNYGFNPLIINPDPDFGGVRKKVESFVRNINRSGRKLGDKQAATLRNLLYDLYEANYFFADDALSWKVKDPRYPNYNKRMPNLSDALRFARAKAKSMYMGTSSKAVSKLEQINRKKNSLYNKLKQKNKITNPNEIADLESQIAKLCDEMTELNGEYLKAIQTGQELDEVFKYNSLEVLNSVVERLENLNSCGIFRNEIPPFDPKKAIWRYDIKSLSQEEKKLFVSFLLEAIFYMATQRGERDDLVEVIILDEAHLFITADDDNPVNVIAKEARKFGLGLFAASQSPEHFSIDFLSNVSTKVILGIDEVFWDFTCKKLRVDVKALEWIVPHQKILIQLNEKGQTKSQFTWTLKKEPNGVRS